MSADALSDSVSEDQITDSQIEASIEISTDR